MARERLRVHDGPVDVFDEVVEEAAPVVGVEVVPDGVDVRHGGVGAPVFSDGEVA